MPETNLAHSVPDQSAANFVQVVEDYFAEEVRLDLYRSLLDVDIPHSSLYLPLPSLGREETIDQLTRYLPLAVAEFLLRHLSRLGNYLPAEVMLRGDGFEVWTGHTESSDADDAYLHRDIDEALKDATGEIRTPLIGSILHVGPEYGVIGGETLMVSDERICKTLKMFRSNEWTKMNGDPAAVQLVGQRAGRLVLFAGHMAHARGPVSRHPAKMPRIVLLANLWERRIASVSDGFWSHTMKASEKQCVADTDSTRDQNS